MPYNFVADSFHTNKLLADYSSEVPFYTENGRFAFLEDLGATMIILGSLESCSGLPSSVN